MIQICTKCLYPSSHPLGILFDSDGVCSGCKIHSEKYLIDWQERGMELRSLLKQYKSSSNYDCVVPVTGSGDSFFIVDQVKNVFGMNPLLVSYNNQFNTSVGIRNLARLKLMFDCDVMTLTVNPVTLKKLTRETVLQKGSIYWHTIAGQTVFPVQIACKFKIPLIIWGAHQGVDQVGMFSHHDRVEMTRKYRHEHDLMGIEAEDLIGGFEQISEEDITPFVYPEDAQISSVGVRGIYLNNYVFWNSRRQHEDMIRRFGYQSLEQTRTFDSYSNASCWNYSDLHDYIKFIKHGYGKVVDHASREIRLGQMTRLEGLQMIEEYLFNKPRNHNLYFEWLGVSPSGFQYVIDQFRNQSFWHHTQDLRWEYLDPYQELRLKLESTESKAFEYYKESAINESDDSKTDYIVIGKGVR